MTTDMFGREVKVGAVIVYPNRRGSTTEMRFGKVLALDGQRATLLTPRGRVCIVCAKMPEQITNHDPRDGAVARVRFTHFERAVVIRDVPASEPQTQAA